MPLQISAHLQATIYAIAEKGAAMIIEDQKKRGGHVSGDSMNLQTLENNHNFAIV